MGHDPNTCELCKAGWKCSAYEVGDVIIIENQQQHFTIKELKKDTFVTQDENGRIQEWSNETKVREDESRLPKIWTFA